MSPGDFTVSGDSSFDESDLDRLADYAAGLLHEAEAAQVAARVATDPVWAQAHASLVAADPLIQATLRAEAADRIEPMPAYVMGRIDAALAEQARPGAKPPAGPEASVTALSDHAPRRRSRRQKFLTVIAGGVAAAAALVIGVNVSTNMLAKDGVPSSAGAPEFSRDSPVPNAGAPLAPTDSLVVITASGLDYAQETLGRSGPLIAGDASANPSPRASAYPGTSKSVLPLLIPDAVEDSASATTLARLSDRTALDACLTAIGATYPGTVTAVDFARYEGEPALVVLIRQAVGPVVVAVGPECGIVDADIKATSKR